MKRLHYLLAMALLLPACGEKEPPVIAVDSVTVSPSTLNMTEGDTQKLQASVSPSDATDKTVTWSSSANEVASVDQNGKVTALKAGTATITVTTKDGGKKATCAITVKAKVIPVTGVTLDASAMEVDEGFSFMLTATVNPDNATDKSVTWSSSDAAVATISQTGEVTAVKKGTATITVTTNDGGKTATCAVTVKRPTTEGGNEGYGNGGEYGEGNF